MAANARKVMIGIKVRKRNFGLVAPGIKNARIFDQAATLKSAVPFN
jgi:hypothetical protein